MNAMKGYRTVAFNVIMTVLMGISLWSPGSELPDAGMVDKLLGDAEGVFTAIWGAGNLVLRAVTNTAVFKATTPDNA